MSLPDFKAPSLDELRTLWRTHRGETDIERLLLEVQHQRLALLQMHALITAGIADAQRADPLTIDGASPLRTLEARILQELIRIEQANKNSDATPRATIRERS
ncbi:hypothetical protein [Paraburkholderia caribensis]|uniref:hypothetical protein n=1 Tax=Paraburkholderia caribensis TaxID=75105 RepID=UPI0007224239|nr:hypothetical protein [Paraburkholderia caribensis]ALP62837.1 hypothetical protein AN416_09660 [Paraburkholderia caribensis]AUT51933.1 hypothetical protein C2L66_08745 [Paraburkholderia caribensis]